MIPIPTHIDVSAEWRISDQWITELPNTMVQPAWRACKVKLFSDHGIPGCKSRRNCECRWCRNTRAGLTSQPRAKRQDLPHIKQTQQGLTQMDIQSSGDWYAEYTRTLDCIRKMPWWHKRITSKAVRYQRWAAFAFSQYIGRLEVERVDRMVRSARGVHPSALSFASRVPNDSAYPPGQPA